MLLSGYLLASNCVMYVEAIFICGDSARAGRVSYTLLNAKRQKVEPRPHQTLRHVLRSRENGESPVVILKPFFCHNRGTFYI